MRPANGGRRLQGQRAQGLAGEPARAPIHRRVLRPLRRLVSRGSLEDGAREALDRVRVTISLLSLTKADLSAAEALVAEGDSACARSSFEEAMTFAARAEKIAFALEEEFRGATHATSKLREVILQLDRAGLSTDAEKAALLSIRTAAGETREMAGVPVPDYAASREHAHRALSQAELRWGAYDKADRAIFQAELAIDASKDSLASSPSLEGAHRRLEKARAAMAAGAYEAATEEASTAEATIDRALRAHDDTGAALESVERTITQMRAIGIPTTPVEAELERGRDLLNAGRFADAREAFAAATKEAIAGAQRYRDALEAQTEALAHIRKLGEEGLTSADAEQAVASAKSAIRAGNLAGAIESFRAASVAATHVQETKVEIQGIINETRSRVDLLRQMGSPIVNDVEEIVVRAENEFSGGDFIASREDLRIAGILMQTALPENPSEPPPHAAKASPNADGAQ